MAFETEKITTNNKSEFYHLLAKQADGLLSVETNPIANAANLSSLMYHAMEQVNWLGFYFENNGELVLGPFQGQVACTRIEIGKGVCGTAFAQGQTQVVKDVHQFPGHIFCDMASASEIVVPLFNGEKIIGVLDIDSPVLNRFDEDDRIGCEKLAQIYMNSIKI